MKGYNEPWEDEMNIHDAEEDREYPVVKCDICGNFNILNGDSIRAYHIYDYNKVCCDYCMTRYRSDAGTSECHECGEEFSGEAYIFPEFYFDKSSSIMCPKCAKKHEIEEE